MKNLKNMYYKSCAVLTVGVLASDNVFAKELKDVAKKVDDNLQAFIAVFKVASYLAGLAFGIAGLLKLKEYVDKPGQGQGITPAMGRLLIGGLFLALPSVLNVFADSTVGTDGSIGLGDVDIS